MTWLDRLPLWILVVAALALGMAPFWPEPHLVEKLRWLAQGALTRPIDIFDLALHAVAPPAPGRQARAARTAPPHLIFV